MYNSRGVINMTASRKRANVQRGMKKVEYKGFKFSSAGLKKAQENLKDKEVFKVNEDNYKGYERFILDSYSQ
jgi:hypothetical protein